MRVPIPQDIANEILFRQDRACCVCQERGKRVQIHHIDEDPSNNELSNLAVVCFNCHDETQIKGGFGRTLNAGQITRYRDDWEARVAQNRARADELLVEKQLGVIKSATASADDWRPLGKIALAAYAESIPETLRKAYELAQPEWDKGLTSVAAQATYQIVSVAERLWVVLSACYPPHHFGGKEAEEFISEYIAKRYELHHALLEPEGPGTGGTMMRPVVANGVLEDLQDLIVSTVRAILTFVVDDVDVDIHDWTKRFKDATRS